MRQCATMTRNPKVSSTETAPPSPRSRAQHWSKVVPPRIKCIYACLKPTKHCISPLRKALKYLFLSLESEFSHSQYADLYTREKLSAEIKLPEDTIKVDSSFLIIKKLLTQNRTFNHSAIEMIVCLVKGLVFKQTG